MNSPLPEADFPTWEYVDGYEVVVSGAAFGASGFGSVSVPSVHNSPSKLGFNEQKPTPCGGCVTNRALLTGNCGGLPVIVSADAYVCVTTNLLRPSS